MSLSHSPSIHTLWASRYVHHVESFFFGNVIQKVCVVTFAEMISASRNSTANAFFNKQVHIWVGREFKLRQAYQPKAGLAYKLQGSRLYASSINYDNHPVETIKDTSCVVVVSIGDMFIIKHAVKLLFWW